MPAQPLRFQADGRYTCRQCGRCCRRGWEIVVLGGEHERYRAAGAERWFREAEHGPDGATRDPFERLPGQPGVFRIRKRPDGACGFLSPDDRCRIHEHLGGESKPLTCRMFPFRFHPTPAGDVATLSYSCPTVVGGHGDRLARQSKDLRALRDAWFAAYPERPHAVELVAGRALPVPALNEMREVLHGLLERPDPDGAASVRMAARRIAAWTEDLSRYRVRRLADDALTEYVRLTGRFALRTDRLPPVRPPTRLGRLLVRGFLFAVCAADVMRRDGRTRGARLSLRWELMSLLAHLHGLGPPAGGFDLGRADAVRIDPDAPGLRGVAERYLHSAVETLGTGRCPVLDELAVAVAYLDAAGTLASMRAGEAGRDAVSVEDYETGLLDASDLTHAEDRGWLGRFLVTLSGGSEALHAFAHSGRA